LKGCFNWSTSPLNVFAVYWLHWLKLQYVCTLRPFLDLPDLVSFLRERSLSWKQLISINIWLKANFGKWSKELTFSLHSGGKGYCWTC
jgi:hypothetical protein